MRLGFELEGFADYEDGVGPEYLGNEVLLAMPLMYSHHKNSTLRPYCSHC